MCRGAATPRSMGGNCSPSSLLPRSPRMSGIFCPVQKFAQRAVSCNPPAVERGLVPWPVIRKTKVCARLSRLNSSSPNALPPLPYLTFLLSLILSYFTAAGPQSLPARHERARRLCPLQGLEDRAVHMCRHSYLQIRQTGQLCAL